MRKYHLLIYFLIHFSFTSCKKEKFLPVEGELEILTYNIAGLPQGISGSSPVNNTKHIGVLINDYQIVHIQEDFNYNGRLYNHANHPHRTKWSGPAGFGDGLNTLSDFFIKDFKRFAWFNCNGTDCLTPKGFSYSRIEVAPGVLIDFYNTHHNAGSSSADLQARRQNMRQLADYIEKNSEGEAVVVMGDFNCRYTRTGDRLSFLTDLGLVDVWIELARNGETPEANEIALRDCDDPSGRDCEIVDKVFYRSSEEIKLKPLVYEVPEEKFTRNGKWLSDHNPVFVNMHFDFTP